MLKINADWFTGSLYFQNKENKVPWKPLRQKLKFVFVNSLTHSETINLSRSKQTYFGRARIMRVSPITSTQMKEQRLHYKLFDVDDA